MTPIANDAVVAIRLLNNLSHSGLAPEQREMVIQAERFIARILVRLAASGVNDVDEIDAYLEHSLELVAEARAGSVDKCEGCPRVSRGQ